MAMAQKKNLRETDLYMPVHDYLESLGYQVQGEVKGCDLAAVMGDDLIVVELKTAFNLKLLCQAVKRQRVTESVYVAVPKPKGGTRTSAWGEMCMLLRRLEIGLITVSLNKKEDQVEVHFHPNTFDRIKSMRTNKRVRYSIIKENAGRSGHYNTGGSNKTKLITSYREQAIHIACCIMKYGVLSPSQLKKMGTCAKTPNILRDNHYGWFVKTARGMYELDHSAREFIKGYPELQEHYMKKVYEWEEAQSAAEAERTSHRDDGAENKKKQRRTKKSAEEQGPNAQVEAGSK